MKKILYIFLTLSILSIGCSKEEDDSIQLTQETPTDLDQNLFGIWKNTYEPSGSYSYKYYRSFSSNGMWNSWTIRTNTNSGQTYTDDKSTGTWWSEDNYIFFEYNVFEYSISGNTLRLTESEQFTSDWTKQ
jgi:hypothetical protein